MKYDGIVYDYLEENGKVTEAIVTDNRIAISYEQGGWKWQIAASSGDGRLFRGVLSSGGPDPECVVELAVYKAKTNALVVFGEWLGKETGNSFQFVFRLFPSAPLKKTSTKTRKPARKGK
jgi:hypothetical protein